MSSCTVMLTEHNFSVLWNMNVLFVDTDSGSQTGTCLSDINEFVAAHAGNNKIKYLKLHGMFELTWNSFSLKLNEGLGLRYQHVPQRESAFCN